MSLLRTRDIQVGSLLAFTGIDPTDGQASFIWGSFSLVRGDVVQVVEIETSFTSVWAKVLVAIMKGKFCGRAGHVGIDMSVKLQRSWQALTMSGSMCAVRQPSLPRVKNG